MKRYFIIILLILPLLFMILITKMAIPVKSGLLILVGLVLTLVTLFFLILSLISNNKKEGLNRVKTVKPSDRIRCPGCKKEISVLRLIFSLDKEIRCKACNAYLLISLPGRWPVIEKIVIIMIFLTSMIFALIGVKFIQPGIIMIIILIQGLISILFFMGIYNYKAIIEEIDVESGEN